jgi:multimeric flavodoxin WrbA
MQVLVINGSARKEKGYTAKVLGPFIEGMEQASAQVELIYSKQLNVNPCTGEFDCWHKNPGKCYINDSMQEVYPKLKEADILVLGIPVYLPLPGEMQNLLNRLMPLMNPVLRFSDKRTQIKFYDDVKIKKMVLVSVCGWWEMGNFEILKHIVREICLKSSAEFVGSVLRPHGYLLSEKSDEVNEVCKAIKDAGISLVKEGILPKRLLEVIAQPLISEKELRKSQSA